MNLERFELDKEYGIVLEGGGAKGAYQIGVWKALLEFGVKIKAVAGVSVGALNGALMCMGDFEKAVDIWKNISYSRIMNVDNDQMEKLVTRKFKDLKLQEVTKQGKSFLVEGGFDVTPLKQLIDESIDENRIKESDIEFIMGTFNVNNMKEIEISAKEAQEGYLKDYLLASSNFPLFKNEKLNGITYLDGGIINNVPIDMLINRGYKNIIVIRIFGIGLEKKVKIPDDVNVIYIAPKLPLCNVMEFDRKKAVRNITLGYFDALRILKPLAGSSYYIDTGRSEKDYLEVLLSLNEESIKGLQSQAKQDNIHGGSLYRRLTEEVLPHLASLFKLGKSWGYGDLYYAILEYMAKKYRIKKFRIYEEKEFCQLILDKIEDQEITNDLSDHIAKVAKAVIHNVLQSSDV
jgi:NTE family protein